LPVDGPPARRHSLGEPKREKETGMTTVRLWTDAEVDADPRVKAVFDDIRATRKSDFVNNVWRGLANHPDTLERIWAGLKDVMIKPSALDPLVKEMVYIAVSTANGCNYCIHSHWLQLPVDPQFLVEN